MLSITLRRGLKTIRLTENTLRCQPVGSIRARDIEVWELPAVFFLAMVLSVYSRSESSAYA
jgi:hypothetical protein